MSFILDALKKSEAERQRQDSPGIASIPASEQKRSAGRWTWILSGLLVVNLTVLAVLMLRPSPGIQPDSVAGPAAAAPASVQPAAPPTTAPQQSPARQPASDTREAAVRQPVVQERVLQPPASTNAPVTNVAATETPAERVASGLPTLNDLQAQGVLQLPEMHLDIHVFSGQAAERFVFVNMKKYTEGATLSEGPAVQEITQEGVVLDYLGTRFLLPRE